MLFNTIVITVLNCIVFLLHYHSPLDPIIRGSTAQRTGDRIVRVLWTPSNDAALVRKYLGVHELARTQLEERDSGANPTTARNEVPRVRMTLHESSRSWHSFQPRQSWGHRTAPPPPRSTHQLIRTWHYYRPQCLSMDPARRAQIIGYLLLPRHHLHECNHSLQQVIVNCKNIRVGL